MSSYSPNSGQDSEPILMTSKPRIPGLHPGAIWTSEDFDESLPDEFWAGGE